MPGLIDISKEDAKDILRFVLGEYKSYGNNYIDLFLEDYSDLLQKLYDTDYSSNIDFDSKSMELINEYHNATDALKKDYRDKRIVKLTGASVSTVGGVLAFTPLAPIGWVAMGIGGIMNTTTDIIDVADKNKQNKWNTAKEALYSFAQNPFKDTAFGAVYDALTSTFNKQRVKETATLPNFSVIVQILGCNYFLSRKENSSHTEAIQKLKNILEFYATSKYDFSLIKSGSKDSIKDLQDFISNQGQPSYVVIGTLITAGILSGITISSMLLGIRIAAINLTLMDSLAHCLLRFGDFTLKALNSFTKVAPVIVIVAGVTEIVLDSIDLAKIDEKFKPYYDFENDCKKAIDEVKDAYHADNAAITEIYKFINDHSVVN